MAQETAPSVAERRMSLSHSLGFLLSHNGYDCFQGGKTYVPRWSLLFRGRYEEEQQTGCGKNYGTDPHLYALELGDALKRERRQKNRSLP